MIRRPPRSTQSRSSAASDVYKRQTVFDATVEVRHPTSSNPASNLSQVDVDSSRQQQVVHMTLPPCNGLHVAHLPRVGHFVPLSILCQAEGDGVPVLRQIDDLHYGLVV